MASSTALDSASLGDYEAKPPSREQAQELVATAERFLDAISAMQDD